MTIKALVQLTGELGSTCHCSCGVCLDGEFSRELPLCFTITHKGVGQSQRKFSKHKPNLTWHEEEEGKFKWEKWDIVKTEEEVNGQQDKIHIWKGYLRTGDLLVHGDLSLLVPLGLAPQCLLVKARITTPDFPENINIYIVLPKYGGDKKTSAHESANCLHDQSMFKPNKAYNCSSNGSLSLARNLHLRQEATFMCKFSLHVCGGCWQPAYYAKIPQGNPGFFLTKGVLQHHAGDTASIYNFYRTGLEGRLKWHVWIFK